MVKLNGKRVQLYVVCGVRDDEGEVVPEVFGVYKTLKAAELASEKARQALLKDIAVAPVVLE